MCSTPSVRWGLGLSICQSVTTLLGGKIWLDESYTQGSKFVFELPKNKH